MPRFALLEHDAPDGLHFDLLLETGERPATWAVDEIPAPGRTISCRRLPDHRAIYLDYEGPVSGDRGTVRRIDGGEFELIEQDGERLVARLDGERLRGVVTIDDGALRIDRA